MKPDDEKEPVTFTPDWYHKIETWIVSHWYVVVVVLYILFFFVWPMFINEPPDDPYFNRR